MTAKTPVRKTSRATTTRPAPKKAAAAKTKVAKAKVAKKAAPTAAKKSVRAKPPRARLTDLVTETLDDLKGQNIVVLDVRQWSDVTDTIVIATGTSDRHVKSLASRVQSRAREAGYRSVGMEGEREGEWVLVDLQDVIVHVMLPRIREFYALEKLWDVRGAADGATV
jgi:ribosome-associated protein